MTTTQQLTQEQVNFALEFARHLNTINPYSYLFNPMLQNITLKNINMDSTTTTRDQLKQMISNPKDNEQALRRLSRFLYNTQMSYKRMTHYLADILTFDWYPVPTNITEEDLKKPGFKKDYEAFLGWFDKFNVKKEFKKAMLKMSTEDGYFTCLRRDSDGDLFLQEMPIDYCLIDESWKYGYLYSFNMQYFQQPGVDINGYDKEFKTYYKQVQDMKRNKTYYPNIRPEIRNGQWVYWQQIKPELGWVFKFHNSFAGLVPPFLGVFLDLIDIPAFKDMQLSKAQLDLYKLIIGTVPRQKDNKTNNVRDDFAIEASTLAQFVQLVKNSLKNEYVDFKAVPLEDLKEFSFSDTADKTDSLDKLLNNISSQAGIDKAGMNTDRPNQASIGLSKIVDAEFIIPLYEQFSDFCNYHANKMTKKYKFKIIFEGTIFDRKERKEQALTLAQNGIITPKLASAHEMTIKELTNGMLLMKYLKFMDNLTPIQSSFQMPANNRGGRPAKKEDDLNDEGMITRDAGSNIDKEIGD